MLMLIVPHILASPLNPPVVGIITVYQSFIWRPANRSPSFYIKEGKKEAVIKKLFHLIANLHYTIFSDLILWQISQAIWASSEKVLGKKKFFKMCLGQPNCSRNLVWVQRVFLVMICLLVSFHINGLNFETWTISPFFVSVEVRWFKRVSHTEMCLPLKFFPWCLTILMTKRKKDWDVSAITYLPSLDND